MKKHSKTRKWKVLIVCSWILFLAAVDVGCIGLQRANVYEKAKTDLINQAESISGQFTDMVETNFYTRAVLHNRLISEVKAISFVLGKYDDIDEAGGFLDDIVSTTEIKHLCIYDRDGNIVFRSGDKPEETPDADDITYWTLKHRKR